MMIHANLGCKKKLNKFGSGNIYQHIICEDANIFLVVDNFNLIEKKVQGLVLENR